MRNGWPESGRNAPLDDLFDPYDRSDRPAHRPWWKKLAWMVAIWAASVAALAVVAGLLKLLMRGVGLSL